MIEYNTNNKREINTMTDMSDKRGVIAAGFSGEQGNRGSVYNNVSYLKRMRAYSGLMYPNSLSSDVNTQNMINKRVK